MSSAAKWLLTILILGLLHLMLMVLIVATMEPGVVTEFFPFGFRNQQELASIALIELCILAVVALAFVIRLHRDD